MLVISRMKRFLLKLGNYVISDWLLSWLHRMTVQSLIHFDTEAEVCANFQDRSHDGRLNGLGRHALLTDGNKLMVSHLHLV